MNRAAMIQLGIATYKVGDVYEVNAVGEVITDADKAKWFVSVPAESPLSSTVQEIALADTEELAWEMAARHYGFDLTP